MGGVVYPSGLSGVTPDKSGPSNINADEWWDAWLSGTTIQPLPPVVLTTTRTPCPTPTGIGGGEPTPARFKVVERRQNQKNTIYTYTIARYKLETSWWYIAGWILFAIALVVVVVGTAGVGGAAFAVKLGVTAAIGGAMVGAGGVAVSVAGILISEAKGGDRGDYLGGGTTSVTVGPQNDGAPYDLVTQDC